MFKSGTSKTQVMLKEIQAFMPVTALIQNRNVKIKQYFGGLQMC